MFEKEENLHFCQKREKAKRDEENYKIIPTNEKCLEDKNLMVSKRQDSLQNSVFVLKNDLLKYANEIAEKDENHSTSVVEAIYNALLQMKSKENNGEDTRELRRAFGSVPLVLHVQVLKSFIESFYISNHLEKKVVVGTPQTGLISKELLDTVDNFYKLEGKILSPFEAIYLVTGSYVEKDVLKEARRHRQATMFIGDIKYQRRILIDFLQEYDRKYSNKIREEVNLNEN